jgi:hypothetical protein
MVGEPVFFPFLPVPGKPVRDKCPITPRFAVISYRENIQMKRKEEGCPMFPNGYYLPQDVSGFYFYDPQASAYPEYPADHFQPDIRQQQPLERRVERMEREHGRMAQEVTRQNNEIRRLAQEVRRLNDEIGRINQEIRRINEVNQLQTRRLMRLNQRLRAVENRFNFPFVPTEDGF